MNSGIKLLLWLFISILFIILIEFSLWLSWKVTKSHKLNTIYGNQISLRDQKEKLQFNSYINDPQNYLKIAIFGGSSAMGSTAEISLANVINYELKKLADTNIFVKNYAHPGKTFHKEQAEILKNVISHYDILVLHVGHNEWGNLYYDNCGLPIFNIKFENCENELKKRKPLIEKAYKEINNKFDLFKFFERKSRVYAITFKIRYRLSNIHKGYNKNNKNAVNPFSPSGLNRPNQSEKYKAFSTNQIEQMLNMYQSDLLEIAKLAKKKDKTVIIIGAIGNVFWPPYFSKHPEKMSKSNVKYLNLKLNEVEKNLKNKNFFIAQDQINEILKISPNHAYANYLKANLLKAQGNLEKSWSYFVKSSDEDGFPHRALSKINLLSKKISKNFENNLVYVDYPLIVKQLILSDYPHKKLFSDWVHPSTLGHIIMGRNAVCQISKFQEFKSNKNEDFCKIPEIQDLELLVNNYKKALNVSLTDTIKSKKIIYRWAVLLSRISAHPEDFYKIAEDHLDYIYPNSSTDENDKLSILVLSALFQAKLGEKCDNLKVMLKKALSISPNKFKELLENPFPFPEKQLNIKQSFIDAGLNINLKDSPQIACSI